MSFYGNVTYYLSNAFNKIIYRNTGSASANNASLDSKLGPGIPAYEYPMNPRNRKDETILETGNKWIVFADPQGTVENNQIKIYHQVVNNNVEDVVVGPTAGSSAGSTEVSELEFGSILSIPTITYDNAGHIVSNGALAFQLPIPQGEEEITSAKDRISYLEYLLTGNPGQVNEVPDLLPEDYHPYSYYINRANTLLSPWNLGTGATDDKQTIATALHELQYRVGVRDKRLIPNSDEYYYPEVNESSASPEYPPNSLIAIARDADDSSRITREYARTNRRALNAIIRAINQEHNFGIEELQEN